MLRATLPFAALVLASATAWAQPAPGPSPFDDAPAEPAPVQVPPPPDPSAPVPEPVRPPDPWPAAPALDAPNYYAYEANRKSEGIALLIEFLLMGAGSIYADHASGALVSWGCTIAGILLIVKGIDWDTGNPDDARDDTNEAAIVAGIGLVLGGRIYGLIDAYSSTKEFNRKLGKRYRMPDDFAFGVAPLRSGSAVVWGPTFGLRF